MKEAQGVDTSHLAAKLDLTVLKAAVDKVDVGKLKIFLAYLSKLSNAVDNNVVKSTMHDKLVTKLNAINNKVPRTNGLICKLQYNSIQTKS